MQLSNRLEERKKNLITSLMLSVKGFNEKHRSIAAVTTFFTLLLVTILSALFSIAIFVCSICGKNSSTGKRIAGIVMAGVLLCIAVFAAQRFTAPADTEQQLSTEIGENHSEEDILASDSEKAPEPEEAAEPEEVAEPKAIPEPEAADAAEITDNSANPRKSWDTSDIELDKLIEAYPEMVGWVYFEDGHISYPIMHTTDNEKYGKLDYMGDEAPTGAIFLDYRSSSDFEDANSIIYGHNMKDGTMFGSLREYRKDPAYYNDHQYFQVITPKKAYRYLIFEYMDVPETYVLYDYVAEAALEFVKDAEPVRIKSYMDSEIPVTKDSKVVTLSTCTKKDDLQFVVLGVLEEESDH